MSGKYYVPSNKFSGAGMALLFITIAALGSVLAIAYLTLIKLIPFVYINVVLAAAYGFFIGWVGDKICGRFKLRNPSLVFMVALLATLVFTYLKWVIYISNLFEVQVGVVITDPVGFWEAIKIVNEEGTWSIGRYSTSTTGNVTGIFLWIVWIAEAALINGITIFMAVDKAKSPFIEKDNDWAQEAQKAFFVEHFNVKNKKHEIENNHEVLLSCPRLWEANGKDYVKITFLCSQDVSENYLNIDEMVLDKKGKNYQRASGIKNLAADKDLILKLLQIHSDDVNVAEKAVANFEESNSEQTQSEISNAHETHDNANSFVNNIEQPVSFEDFAKQSNKKEESEQNT